MNSGACNEKNIAVQEKGDSILVSIIGDFTNATTPSIHECCKKMQKKEGVKRIVLDFARVGKTDTSAFACIISFIKEHMGSAMEINITNLREPEEGLLRMLKIEKMVKVI